MVNNKSFLERVCLKQQMLCMVYCEASISPSNTPDVPPTPTVHIFGRVDNMEAMVVAFLAEHSLPFTLSDKLIKLSLKLSTDSPALKKLKYIVLQHDTS